nr:hypothetical protein Hi04_10k_c2651_00031 [uncultured bacterium]
MTTNLRFCLTLGAFVATLPAVVRAQAQVPPMDREKEIALALSACPSTVASGAGVYVLGKTGYEKARDSQNGFVAIVGHALPISQEPQCMDAEGARTHLLRLFKQAELRAQGKTPEEIQRYVADAFARGEFVAPSKPGVDYMLSTQNLPPDAAGKGNAVEHFPPHVMIYAPFITNKDLGVDGSENGPLLVVGEGTPHALIIITTVPHDMAHHSGGN